MRDGDLTDRERAILDFERSWVAEGGAAVAGGPSKGGAVRDAFGVTPARYYQVLAALLDREAARRYDALLVTRLRRRRERRAAAGAPPLGLTDQGGRGHTQ